MVLEVDKGRTWEETQRPAHSESAKLRTIANTELCPSVGSVLALTGMSDILLGTCGWGYAEWEGIL
jgi:hypothetical protein